MGESNELRDAAEVLIQGADRRQALTFDERADADPRWDGIVVKPGTSEE